MESYKHQWGLQVQLEREATWREVAVPSYLRRWVDLRAPYACHFGKYVALTDFSIGSNP